MQFDLLTTDPASQARAGKLTTDHGVIETPIFMPVGLFLEDVKLKKKVYALNLT